MLNENSCRRSSFQNGTGIRLADGNIWIIPAANTLNEAVGPLDMAHETLPCLVDAVWESEDRSELLRAELALMIHLLGRNYQLGPGEYRSLLEIPGRRSRRRSRPGVFEPGDPGQRHADRPAPLVPPRRTPRQIRAPLHQTCPHWNQVHLAQLLFELAMSEDREGIVLRLPEPVSPGPSKEWAGNSLFTGLRGLVGNAFPCH